MRIRNADHIETEIAAADYPQWEAAGWTDVDAKPAPTASEALATAITAAGPEIVNAIPGISDKAAAALIAWALPKA